MKAEGKKLEVISTCEHKAWIDKRTGKIMLSNDEDGYYVQVFETPREFNRFIQMLIRILGEKRRDKRAR